MDKAIICKFSIGHSVRISVMDPAQISTGRIVAVKHTEGGFFYDVHTRYLQPGTGQDQFGMRFYHLPEWCLEESEPNPAVYPVAGRD